MIAGVEGTASEYRIERYSRGDRERVFELLRVAKAAGFASSLIDQWNWKYDDNPFNREAEYYRRAHRAELLRIREQYPPEVLSNWDSDKRREAA